MAQTANTSSAERTFTVNIKDQITDGGIWRMDWKNGRGMVRCTERPELPKGTRIVSFGYAGQEDIWAMTGRTETECVKVSENWDGYFSHPYNNVDRLALPLSEKFGIGFYYDLDAAPFSDEEVASAIVRADEWIARKEAEKREAEEAHARAIEETRAKYAGQYEEKTPGAWFDTAHVAKNIRRDLGEAFPGAKVSVRKSDYSTIYVSWTDGPSEAEVEEVVGKFRESCAPDPYNDDLWDYSDTPFTELYGGVRTIWLRRDISAERLAPVIDEAEAICPACAGEGFHYTKMEETPGAWDLYNKYGREAIGDYWISSCEIARRVLSGQSFYEAPDRPKKKAADAKKGEGETTSPAGVEIVDYSEKAIAVKGDTRPHADTLKALGGRFNPRLSCGAGWIFSKKKEAEVRKALGL